MLASGAAVSRRSDVIKVASTASGSVLQALLSALAALVSTALLPLQDRGHYVLIWTVLALSAPVSALGSSVGFRRRRSRTTDPGSLERRYLRVSFLAAGLHALWAPPVAWLATKGEVPDNLSVWIATGMLAFGQTLSWQFIELWFGRHRFKHASMYAVLNAGCTMTGAAWALVSANLAGVLWAHAVASTLLQFVQLLHIRKGMPSASLQGVPAESLVRLGLPSVVMTLGMLVAFRVDRFILGWFSGAEAVAVYALAASFAEMPRFLAAAIGQLENSKAAATDERLPLRGAMTVALGLTAAGALGAAIAGLVAIRWFLPVAYTESVVPMVLLLVAEIVLVPYSLIYRVILGGGRLKMTAWLGLAAMVVSVVAYAVGAHMSDARGVALASIFAYAAVSVGCLWVHYQQPLQVGSER